MTEPGPNRARYLPDIGPKEDADALLNDLKALTWASACEHAILQLRGGRRVLVSAGKFGIDLEVVGVHAVSQRSELVFLEIDRLRVRVVGLEMHVHPQPTGPSDRDIMVLTLLNQESSLLYELNGDEEGTTFRRKSW